MKATEKIEFNGLDLCLDAEKAVADYIKGLTYRMCDGRYVAFVRMCERGGTELRSITDAEGIGFQAIVELLFERAAKIHGWDDHECVCYEYGVKNRRIWCEYLFNIKDGEVVA